MDWLTAVRAGLLEWANGWKSIVLALGVLTLVIAAFLLWRPRSRDIHKRGAKILDGRRARLKALRMYRDSGESSLTLGGVRIAPLDETKHFKLIGTTGTGKSTAIRELLRGALERGDRAVITDPDSGYLLSFYDRYRGDII
ncbi:MAG TPA: type IV secretion system DNA-binding domain-containing protein, partial [Steroidobacteraceae bacterium]